MTEYCILPLGVTFPREDFPYVKSVLLVGCKGSGKTMLVNAIASELGAPIFNLSPKNSANSPFQGKANVTKMMHMVFKVARAMKPAIVYIDDAEMVFAKKVPKDDTSDPKRIKKDLLKYLKGLKAEDRVIVIGASSKPWDADKALSSSYERIIYIPKPNYDARYTLILESIKRKEVHVIPSGLNISIITRMTAGFSASEVIDLVDSVLTPRRIRMVTCRIIYNNLNIFSDKVEAIAN